MTINLPKEIYDVLKSIYGKEIEQYTAITSSGKKGDGFLSEMCFVSLQHKRTKEEIHLIIKQSLPVIDSSAINFLSLAFNNEIHFYDKLWPRLKKFQKNIASAKIFDHIPTYLAIKSEKGREKIVMENLTFENFVLHNKKYPLDKQHMEFIFKVYGEYHAISIAYREYNSEEYFQLTQNLADVLASLRENDFFHETLLQGFKKTENTFDPKIDAAILKQIKKYVQHGYQIFNDKLKYNGGYPVLVHGDCWSNNMMFKYDDVSKQIIDMKLLDFQLSKNGTAVHDLSYCFYSGASQEVLDDLGHYLKLYHVSLYKSLRDLGCEPENLYPFDILKKEWKEYAVFGYMMGIITWKGKLTYEKHIPDLTKIIDGEMPKAPTNNTYDEDSYAKKIKSLALHMYKEDFL